MIQQQKDNLIFKGVNDQRRCTNGQQVHEKIIIRKMQTINTIHTHRDCYNKSK